MAVEACIKRVIPDDDDDDDDDDAPIVFKRTSSASASKQKQPSPALKSVSSQSRDKAHTNGKSPNQQIRKMPMPSAAKAPAGKPASASSTAPASSNAPPPVTSKPRYPSDDSDDDKPLASRRNPDSAAGRKSIPAHASKDPTHQSLRDKLASKEENFYDSDDDKPLNAKFASASVVASAPINTPSLKNEVKNDSEDSEDEKPLASRFGSKPGASSSMKKDPGDSDDDKPLVSRFQLKSGNGASTKQWSDSDEEKPLSARLKQNGPSKRDSSAEQKLSKNLNKRPLVDGSNSAGVSLKKAKVENASASVQIKQESTVKKELKIDDNDHIPIAQRMKKPVSSNKQLPIKKVNKVISKKNFKKTKKGVKNSKYSKSMTVPPGSGGGQKWNTLVHNGVIFPPPYKPHGVKMLYNGQPVDLTPEQEEVATMFAVMKDTDYATKPKFIENFMNDWRQILGKNHAIKKFELCDFTPIYEWHLNEKEKKKQMSTEEKKALKEEKLKQEEKYMWAIVDGKKEKVGNFRVEPPGLFRGRGEHPKMGKLKRRIRPRDITINIGKGAPIPECPIPGERWKEVRHDNTVTWLAFWNDPINQKEFKYVFLAASSSLKGQSDKEKYEKARLLKDYIHGIRANYTKDFSSKDATKRQISVATYLIDKLALRAGNEKDDDEADTVGCCTLKVENVTLVPPNKLQFDFLGKDSIRYFNTVEVELPVYKAIGDFQTARKHNKEKKGKGDDLFDMLDTSKLNAHLKELMPGLTAKVFRTYNASITLDEMLNIETEDGTLPEKIAVYQRANKEVAIICNHQRSVSKSHDSQMSRLNEKIDELKAQREELKVDLSRAKKGKPPLKDAEGKTKRNLTPEMLEKKLVQVDAKIEKMELDKKIKDDLKTVALGTSKINYLDPRITVAWCKRHEVPIEKIFNKSLLAKFTWAMDVDPSFRF